MKLINKKFYLFEGIVGIISAGVIPVSYIICNQLFTIGDYIFFGIIHIIAGIATWYTCKKDTFGDLLMWQFIYILILFTILLLFFNLLVRDYLFLSFSVLLGIFLYMTNIPFMVLYCGIYELIKKKASKEKDNNSH